MKSLLQRILKLNKWYLAGIVILVLLVIFGLVKAFGSGEDQEIIAIARGEVKEEVVVTGKTAPKEDVNLAFESGGQVVRVNVRVGDRVSAGQSLVELDRRESIARLREAEAALLIQRSRLEELRKGGSPQEVRLKELAVDQAKTTLEEAHQNLKDEISDTYASADDAVRNKVDQLFSNPRTTNPQLKILVNNTQLENRVEGQRRTIEEKLIAWSALLPQVKASSDVITFKDLSRQNLLEIRSFLDDISLLINELHATPELTQTTIDGYKADIASARTSINTAIGNLNTASERLNTAESNVLIAEQQLVVARTGAKPEAIATQEAYVRQAEANLDPIRVEISKGTIRAPFAGVVTNVDVDPGEIIGANTPAVSVLGNQGLEIKANVPEIDIGKIGVGNPVTITVDAFPGETFKGKVVFIDPAETVIDGVVNFEITIIFDTDDSRMKSGLTANLIIEAKKKENVIFIPQYAIISRDGKNYVQKVQGKDIVETEIKLGLKGTNGSSEVVSGLSAGDSVVTTAEEK